jgi:hemerythrin-like domain-containing protein
MALDNTRRAFLAGSGAFGLAICVPSHSANARESNEEPEISAPEDLMREHGILDRILLIYEEGARRLRAKDDVPPEVFNRPAKLVRQFVEDYHEKLEERFIFPAFEKKNHSLELVSILKEQHEAGRRLTDQILRTATPQLFAKQDARQDVIRTIDVFIRMYRPHEAREETVLFPALYDVIGQKEVKELGEKFEEEEHRLFGEDGFNATVAKVAEIEKQLGIYDLNSFTPK